MCPRGDLPDDIKVLEKERSVSLLPREFVRVLEIGQVLVVGEDRDRVRGPLEILLPFHKSKDDCEEFPVIDIIVPLSQGEGFGEVCTGMKVAGFICLYENCPHSKEGGIGHEREGARDVGYA